MISYFPKKIANTGIVLYLISLTLVSILYIQYVIPWYFMVMGLAEVLVFFLLTNKLSKEWQVIPRTKTFEKKLFLGALLIRLLWVVFSYFFYTQQTGRPFEYGAADAIGYHEEAKWLAGMDWNAVFNYLFYSRSGYSDSGYPLYLTLLYKLIGPQIFLVRVIKAFLSAYMCVLIYRLACRNIGDKVGRMAAVFCALMPNLYVYCGLHVKETEMLFLTVAFLERADYVLRSERVRFGNVAVPILLCISLFFFRTALGAVAALAFLTALMFSSSKVTTKARRWRVALWTIVAVVVLGGSAIVNEVEVLLQNRQTNQELRRYEQTSRGNLWAKYATGSVMAPMVFVLPFTTMVDTGQYSQLVVHGGNFVRNFMGAFVLIGLFSAIFTKKNWRDLSLVGSFTIGYLFVVSLSGFANSERFLLLGLPGLLIMAAYGISELTRKSYKWVKIWYVIVVLMQIGWAYFKIGSRGML
ncbi:MAG: hypothetical protein IKN08_02570 [Bacteroidales bacterium]|nr:hypothetical protein [Bacteroidales bacterium]MBR6227002.1 hypothetical protein [Bacteroidales bacterium]